MGLLIHRIVDMIHSMKDTIRLFHMSLTTILWLIKLKINNYHLLILSNKMQIREIYCQIIWHNYILNLFLFKLLTIPYTSTIPRWFGIINNKLKCWQLMNKISVTQFHFITYWVWMLVHHSSTWHAKRWNLFPRIWNITIFKLDVCLFRP